MLVYLRDGSAQTTVGAATLRYMLQVKLYYLTQSQVTDTELTSSGADPITPGAWKGNHRRTNL